MYNETVEGLLDTPFSAAPGNETEKSIRFFLNFNTIERAFVFGRESWLLYCWSWFKFLFFITALGDLSFGADNLSPNIRFDDMMIRFSIVNDDIIEGREVGSISIAPSTSYDVAPPRFRTIRVVIIDDDGKTIIKSSSITVFIYRCQSDIVCSASCSRKHWSFYC